MAEARKRGGWQRWHFFAIVAAGVAIIGGVWGVVSAGTHQAPPTPGPSPSSSVIVTPSPSGTPAR